MAALISTVYNEARTIRKWLDGVAAQSRTPDEFVIVDGGSKDGTVAEIESYLWPARFPKPRIIVQRCNIAEGRNIAIKNCSAPIIASVDASSVPDANWFREIVRPLYEREDIDVVGGLCRNTVGNEFQRKLARYYDADLMATPANVMPSSRNVAFRRKALESVGGYPEWLTLTAEDALLNQNLRIAGFKFFYALDALVYWESRPDLKSYLRMMYSYGYGSAEAHLSTKMYLRWLLSALVPPVILFSPHPLRDAPFRYFRNASTALGWIAGLIWGRRPPYGWKKFQGIAVSPETQRHLLAYERRR